MDVYKKLLLVFIILCLFNIPYQPVVAFGPHTDTFRPSANSDTVEHNYTGESTNFLCVNEEVLDENSFIWSDWGDRTLTDLYEIPDHTSSQDGRIDNITLYAYLDSDPNLEVFVRYSLLLNIGGSIYGTSSTPIWCGGDGFEMRSHTWATNPKTASEWTWSEIDTLQIGVNLTGGGQLAKCGQLWLDVNWTEQGPSITSISPTNGSSNIDLYPTICASVNSTNNEDIHINWSWYNDPIWVQFDNHTIPGGGAEGGYNYSIELQVNSTCIQEYLTNYPVHVDITSNDFKDTNNGGPIEPSGTGISFWDQTNETHFAHELELYNGATGRICAWVKIPLISPDTNTRFYMWYGDSDDLSDHINVWDANYAAVWHMNDSYFLFDSTTNANHGYRNDTSIGGLTNVTQDVGDAIIFEQSPYHNFFNVSPDASLQMGDNDFTIMSRIKSSHVDAGCMQTILIKRNMEVGKEGEYDILISREDMDEWGVFRVFSTGTWVIPSALFELKDTQGNYSDNNWHSYNGQYRNETPANGYISIDSRVFGKDLNGNNLYSTDCAEYWFYIGAADSPGGDSAPFNFFNGTISELRLSNTARNASWTNATHYNLNGTVSFITVGTKEQHGAATGTFGTKCTTFANATSCGTTYYWKINVSDYIGNETEEIFQFTTLIPQPPSGVSTARHGSSAINLTYTNFTTAGIVGNISNYVRYNTSGYPTTQSDGTFGANTSNEWAIINGLEEDEDYYFSIWTYYEKNGSFCWSPTYSTGFMETSGGNYTISFTWECNLTAVNDAVNYSNTRVWAVLIDGTVLDETTPTTNPFTMNFTTTPDAIYVDWGGFGMIRALTPFPGQREITFFICCEPEYVSGMVLLESQLFYTFQFDDYTPNSIFKLSPESKLYIYNDDQTLGKYYIHQDFWSAEDTVCVALEYGKRYYLGIECNALNMSFLQYIDTGTAQTIYINILPQYNDTYDITQYVSKTLKWQSGAGLFINYTDTATATISATMRIYIYHPENDSYLLVKTEIFYASSYNYLFSTGLGCDPTLDYFVTIEIEHGLFQTNQSITSFAFTLPLPGASADWINGAFISVLGICPLNPVSWTQMTAFLIFFFVLVSFGAYYGEVGVIIASFVLIFVESVVLDDAIIRGLVIGVAIFLIIISAIMYIGTKRSFL